VIDRFVSVAHEIYNTSGAIALHAPEIGQVERDAVMRCLDSGFVSTAGADVGAVEAEIAQYTGAKHALSTVNGTAALHVALMLAGVKSGDAVVMQSLTFVATANAVKHVGAIPEFVDVDPSTLSIDPVKLRQHLAERVGQNTVSACILMHTFGHPGKIIELQTICQEFGIPLIEDAAESLGSYYLSRHTGTFGEIGTLSFNGNKIATAGGGGALLLNSSELFQRGRHLTTTAKTPHAWEFFHDEVAWNYRMPNLNASLLRAQVSKLPHAIQKKRAIAMKYKEFFKGSEIQFVDEPVEFARGAGAVEDELVVQ